MGNLAPVRRAGDPAQRLQGPRGESSAGLRPLQQLAADADVFVENFRQYTDGASEGLLAVDEALKAAWGSR